MEPRDLSRFTAGLAAIGAAGIILVTTGGL